MARRGTNKIARGLLDISSRSLIKIHAVSRHTKTHEKSSVSATLSLHPSLGGRPWLGECFLWFVSFAPKEMNELKDIGLNRLDNVLYVIVRNIRPCWQTHTDFENGFRNTVDICRRILITRLFMHRLPNRTSLDACLV